MASITNLTSSTSSTSSLYGNKNILTGLASGMDTESMIENSIAGYKTRIQTLINQQTKVSWKQDAYRSITDKLVALSSKYTSYTSKTNLASNAFFTNAVKQTTNGKNADKVSATGKTGSEVKLNAVKQLASAARYSVSAAGLMDNTEAAVGKEIDLTDAKLSKISGDLTLAVGNKSVTLSFGEDEVFESAEALAKAINDKLGDSSIGSAKASDLIHADLDGSTIKFTAVGDAETARDSVWVRGVSGDIGETLGIKSGYYLSDGGAQSITVSSANQLYREVDAPTLLSNKTVDVTLDGVTKSISLGSVSLTDEDKASGINTIEDKLMANLQKGVKDAFGSKVTVDWAKDADGNDTKALSFTTSSKNSTLKVTSSVGTALGLGSNGVTNYLDVNNTKLKDIFGAGMGNRGGVEALKNDGAVTVSSSDSTRGTDKAGNAVINMAAPGEEADWRRVDEDGNLLYGLTVNGKQVGAFTENSGLDEIVSAINSSDAGVKVSYSQMTNKFTFNATETGAEGRIDFGDDLAAALFGTTEVNKASATGIFTDSEGGMIANTDENGDTFYIAQKENKYYKFINDGSGKAIMAFDDDDNPIEIDPSSSAVQETLNKARKGYVGGTDAIFNVTVNGENLTLSRSSNVVGLDGLSVTLQNTFNEDFTVDSRGVVSASKTDASGNKTMEALGADDVVTFSAKTDADPIVDAVKSFVEEINDILKSVHDAYTTTPLTMSNNKSYEPLSDDDKSGMSESEIASYEEKAKTGLLFGDSDLSRLYSALRSNITLSGDDRKALEAIGLTTTYDSGLTTLSLDEDKLREALSSDPDSVRQIFAKTTEGGASTNGLMASLSKTLNNYASTSIGSYGILVNKAGTKTKSLTLMSNTLQNQIDSLDKQIDSWQTKMSNKIDYYTRQYTALEQLMNQMNSQSSALSGLTGY